MRLLMVSDVYFPRVNGVSTSIATFIRSFRAMGHHVTLIAPDYGDDDGRDDDDLIRLPAKALLFDPEDRITRLRDYRILLPRLRKENYDLVHIHTPFIAHYAGIHLGRELGIPVIETYHTYFEQYLDHYIRFLPRALLRMAARRFSVSQARQVDTLVVPSQAMLDVLRGYGVTTSAEVIPTGIEPGEFRQGDGQYFRLRNDIAPDRPLLLYVGRVAEEKNIGFLLRMMQRLIGKQPDALLLIAGEGPARPALEQSVRDLGLEDYVQFIGYLDREGELQSCYSAANAFVFASRTETQGLVLLEAMALGVPVVSTAVMGTAEVLAGCEGALVAEESIEDFAGKCHRLLADPELQKILSVNARRHAESWSAPHCAHRMLRLYERLVIESEPAPVPRAVIGEAT